jgi:hypothetical protein
VHPNKRSLNECERRRQLVQHDWCRDAQHAAAEPLELSCAPRVCFPPLVMIPAVDLDNEPGRRCEKADDALPDNDLPPERYAQPLAAQRLPEHRPRERRCQPHLASTLFEES